MILKNCIQRCFTGAALLLCMGSLFIYAPASVFSYFLLGILMLILLTEMPRLYNYNKPWAWLATLVYPCLPFALLINLNAHQDSRHLVVLIFALSCANDVGAYIAGNLWGKNKLCPRLSPKKTLEGFIGGWIWIFALLRIFYMLNLTAALSISFSVALVATAGDLFESWLKRRAHIKDSGTLLPGHGGLLDRFDSSMAVTVFVYLCRNYLL